MRTPFFAAVCLFVSASASAQIPGPNVNMVTGTKFPGGDPWLQKQNEPSGAISTVNACRLLAGANDYRAVNVPGLPGDQEIGDAWVGWYTSINCGQTWYSTLVPGFPQDTSAAGKNSPVYGLTAAGDPTVRAGAGGFFAYSFMTNNRGTNVGKLAVARFLDRNTTEAVTKPETAITYIDTKVWDTGNASQFIDKPTLAVTQGTGTCTLGGRTIPASTVHLVWTVFVGNSDEVIRTKVYYARSSNCGASLDGPATKLSEGYAVTQSASVAVAKTGAIFVAWRQFATDKGDPNQLLVARSIDGGKSFTKGSPVPMASFLPIDQGTTSKTFRTNAFPATATDQWGRLYLAFAVRGFASDAEQSRVVVMSTMDGVVWTMPQAIENGASTLAGHQIMPAISAVGGKLNAVWLDFRDDASGRFDRFIKEIYPIRHTMDVRGAQATLRQDGTLEWTTYGILQDSRPAATVPRISRYLTGDYTGETNPLLDPKQLQWNRPNLKLHAGGTRPFIGDYIDVAGLAYLTQQINQTTTWVPNDGSNPSLATTAAQTFYAFWTDNRDAKVGNAVPEPDSDTAEGQTLLYAAPGTAACSAAGANPPTKTRNSNVYMAQITPGLFVAAPTNSKPSINSRGRIQRAFPVLVRNRTDRQRTFRLTIANQPPDAPATGIASFVQVASPIPPQLPAPVVTADVIIPPNSGTSRTVYVVSGVKYPQIKVNVTELNSAEPLTGSTILNPDAQNADIENADIENADPENADIENNEIHNADIENADIENADIENADIENADIENADIENADIENADIENADIENADIENADIENADIENADIENGALSDYTVDLENHGNTATTYQVKAAVDGDLTPYLFQLIGRRVYKTPTAVGCELKEAGHNQILFNVNLTAADLAPGPPPNPLDPSPTNATVLVAPGEHIKLTLRAWDKDVLTGDGAPPDDGIQPFCPMLSTSPTGLCQTVTNQVTITVASVSSNTGSNTPPVTTFPSTPTPVPFTLIVTNTNDSGPGSLRQALSTANAHAGFTDTISFAIPGAGPHRIAPLSPLPGINETAIIDATAGGACTGAPPTVEIDGSSAGLSHGLFVNAPNTIIRGLALTGFSSTEFAGIFIAGGFGSLVECSYLGLAPDGVTVKGNYDGVRITGSANNTIGGAVSAGRNVISGNTHDGVAIIGPVSGVSGSLLQNAVSGNFIGTDATGTLDRGNGGNGVHVINAAINTIGGSGEARNVISGNTGEGVRIDGSLATGNMIRGNYVGTSADGLADLGNNNSGVYLRKAPANSVIQNLISGNDGFAGIAICGSIAPFPCGGGDAGEQSSNASGNIVQGNLIGTNAAGTGRLGNSQRGISIDGAPNTLVGGPLGGDRNVISATVAGPGLVVFNPGADANVIRGNFIGTDAAGSGNLGNNGPGVLLAEGANTVVSGRDQDRTAPNRIMFNTAAGIQVTGGTVHKLRINRFESNGDLAVRDSNESLPGAPILTAASVSGGVVTVSGSLTGTPGSPYTVDLYVSDACDPSGFGEGSQWFGAVVVTPNGNGVASLNGGFGGNVVSAGQVVTALATTGDHVTTPDLNGSTSEFSGCQMAVPPGFAFSAPSAGGNGHVYEYVPTPGSWAAARDAALARTFRGLPGHLVTITSAFENSIVGAFRFNNDLRGWIGLTDEIVNGTFAWVTGEPVTYTNWSAGEPSNGVPPGTGGEDYVEIFASGAWNDQALSGNGLNQGYVVEYEVNPFVGQLPELIVESLTHSPLTPTAADTITFTAVVRNTGGTAAAPSTLMFAIGGETPGLPQTLILVPSLAPGQTFQVQRQATLPAKGYMNTAIADYAGVVTEGNDSNNTTTDTYTVFPVIGLAADVLPLDAEPQSRWITGVDQH